MSNAFHKCILSSGAAFETSRRCCVVCFALAANEVSKIPSNEFYVVITKSSIGFSC